MSDPALSFLGPSGCARTAEFAAPDTAACGTNVPRNGLRCAAALLPRQHPCPMRGRVGDLERPLPNCSDDRCGSFSLIRSPVLSGGSTIHSGP